MKPKLIVAAVGLLVLGIVGYFIVSFVAQDNKQALETSFDFGDAPDGSQGQEFPSRLASNGARVKKIDDLWLGQAATFEEDSKQVNIDEADDGVRFDADPCKQSTVYFFVGIANPGKMIGTAYLNLYADWNKDGVWRGGDECGAEWAVQNIPLDLGKQTEKTAVYKAQFTAGKNTDMIWYRGAVTLNQKMNEAATGEFASGEIEDYGPKSPADEKYYNFYCIPDPLVINHGSSGDVKILPDLFSEPIFDTQFGKKFQPKDEKRQVTIGNNTFTFESLDKDVDPPKRSVPHFVDIKVSFGAGGKEASIEKSCTVIVEHDEPTIETPSRRSFQTPTEIPQVKTESPQTETHPYQETAPGL